MICRALFFFFNDTATTEIYTLSLHDALPISHGVVRGDRAVDERPARPAPVELDQLLEGARLLPEAEDVALDRKSTRLNSSHANISYAVFCLKKKKITHLCDYS